MKRMLLMSVLAVTLVQPAAAFQPAGWVYFTGQWAYASSAGEWYWFSSTDPLWVVCMRTGGWSRFAGAPLRAYVQRTAQTDSTRTGDDGWLQRGVSKEPGRYTVNANGTTTDTLTGLMWVTAPHTLAGNNTIFHWRNAVEYCNALVFAGHDDWRLPNIRELESQVQYGQNGTLQLFHPFTVYTRPYFSSTSDAVTPSTTAWYMSFADGSIATASKGDAAFFVWPVRGGP